MLLKETVRREELEAITALAKSLGDAEWGPLVKQYLKLEGAISSNAAAGNKPFNESAVIWGLAEFIANKAKAQANAFALRQLIDRICNDRGQRLAPESCLVLRENAILETLRAPTLLHAAARSDLTIAPRVALDLAIEANGAKLGDRMDGILAARMMLQAVLSSVQSKDADAAVAAVIADLPKLPDAFVLSADKTPVATTLYLGGLAITSVGQRLTTIQDSFPDHETAILYARKAFLVNLVLGRPIASPTQAGMPIWQCEKTSTLKCPWMAAEQTVAKVEQATDVLGRIRDKLTSAKSPADRRALVLQYADSLLALVDSTMRAQADGAGVARVMAQAGTIRASIQQVTEAYATSNYAQALVKLLELPKAVGAEIHLPKDALRVVNLATTIASADSASQVVSLFESMAATSITYADKRDPSHGGYIALNAYAGGATGKETVVPGASSVPPAWYASAAVPVGVEVGWPVECGPVAAFGFFVQLIDVGTLTTWRLGESTDVNKAPEVSVAQVFAPGIHLMFGLKNVPFSLGIGLASTPRLRRVTVSGVEEAKARGASRFQITAGMDIPLFP